jgi:hypothetical protein
MTTSPALLSPRGRHLVQLYDDDAALLDNLATYLADGARRGERLIVVARPARVDALRRRLGDVPGLACYDAEATLARFMVDGRPDESRFEAVVAPLVREALAAGRGLRAYGEMVDVLWSSGPADAALALKDLWNGLLRGQDFGLFCGYAIDPLAPGTSAAILSRHTHLIPGPANEELERAVHGAMRETLGAEATDALLPLIRATRHARDMRPGPEATLHWLRSHLPEMADAVLSKSRTLYGAR